MAWKPLETRPHHVSGARGDSGADVSHRTVQAWMDSREKKQPGKGPQNPRKKRATTAEKSGPTAGKKSIPTAGGQRAVSLRSNKQRTITIRIEAPQTQITQQDSRNARQSSTEALTVQTVLKDRKLSSHSSSRKPSRSLSQRRGRLDSEDRGDSSITVQ